MKFACTCVVNGEEDDDFTWVTLREIYENENKEHFVGCLYELMLTHMENATNVCETPVMQCDDLLKRTPRKRA